jgi:hypothetical protein
MAGSDEGRLPGEGRLTKEEWDDLEPLLAEADRVAHERFMESPAAKSLTEEGDRAKVGRPTPGYLLLQRLREIGDQAAIRLFRAVEMYHHELTRGDITVAFLRGKEIGRREAEAKEG